jgi:ATP-dependent Zn protease
MTLVGETIWTKVYTFHQKVHNDDNLHCSWFHKDTKEMPSNSQLHVTFGKCSGPTHSGSSTTVSTTANAEATSYNSSEEFASTKSLQTENSDIFSYLGPIIGILILIIVLGSLVLIVKRRKKSSQNKTVNVDVRTVRPNETTSTAAALQQGTGSSDEFITPATNDDLLNTSGGPKEMEEGSNIADSQESVRDNAHNAPTPQVTASLFSGHQKRENMEETGSNAGGTSNPIRQIQYENENNGLGEAATFSQSMNQKILEALSDGFQQAKKDSQIVLQNQKALLEG